MKAVNFSVRLSRLGRVNWIEPHSKESVTDYKGVEIHVAQAKDGSWSYVVLESNGGSEDNGGYASKAEALTAGKKMADGMVQ